MIEITLHDDTFEELRSAAGEAGQLISYSQDGTENDDKFSVGGIIYNRYRYIPTEEDIRRREEFEATPFGQTMKAMMAKSAKYAAESIIERNALLEFLNSDKENNWQWPDSIFPTTLKIRLPDE